MGEVELKELLLMFWKRKTQMILIVLIFVLLGVIKTYFNNEPSYKASTTLLLTQITENSEDVSISYADMTLNSKLISSYGEIVKTDNVLSEVVNNINNPDISIGNIKGSVTVQAVNDTGILKINVTNSNPNYAAVIANETAKVFSEKIVEIYNISNIYVLDRAEPTNVPYNINHKKDIIIYTFIGIVVSIMFVISINLLSKIMKEGK